MYKRPDQILQPLQRNQRGHEIYSVLYQLLLEFVLKLCTISFSRNNTRFENTYDRYSFYLSSDVDFPISFEMVGHRCFGRSGVILIGTDTKGKNGRYTKSDRVFLAKRVVPVYYKSLDILGNTIFSVALFGPQILFLLHLTEQKAGNLL